ncbi:uncharacterized protein LOC117824623 [Notolabrus celidotus]|uniref:uncharacterized protein LOC117824623 n=1 Tax=Notolabrus celidotus TaxID=1203425 RepID=UPI00149076A3|nr:uncharacterized protein LOC117824623 [Notolabrus celidotus]
MSEQTQISDFSAKDKESLYSLSQSSLDEDRVSIATSVWSSPASDISERISHDIQSEESRRASSTGIKKMSDSSQIDEEADELMKCDDLLEDKAVDFRLNLSFINEERSRTLSWGSLSWDSRTTCYWSDRPSSSASSSSANSAMSKVTEEDAGTVTGINAPVNEQKVHPEETKDEILTSDEEDPSHQEEAEAGEAKQTEPSDPAPASSKTTISTRGKFFRWLKKNKIHPVEVDVSSGQSIKISDCPPETCSSIEEDAVEVSAETKTKKGNGFTQFFRHIFSKNKKKLNQDKMENGQKKAGIKVPVEEQEVHQEETDDEVQTLPDQEEAEAGEVKQREQSDSVTPASSKTTISTRGRLFRLKNKIHPVEADVISGQSMKSPHCPPETCSSIEEDTVEVHAVTKTEAGNGFTRFFRRIFSKKKKDLKQDKMENGLEKTHSEQRVTLSSFSWCGAVS